MRQDDFIEDIDEVMVEDVADDYVAYMKPEVTEAATQVLLVTQDAQVSAKPMVDDAQVTAFPQMTSQEVQHVATTQE